MADPTLSRAINQAGGVIAVAKALQISHQAVCQWKRCPPLRVTELAKLSGVSARELRPDIFGGAEIAA